VIEQKRRRWPRWVPSRTCTPTRGARGTGAATTPAARRATPRSSMRRRSSA
jgi:hypothetical protein